MTSPLGGRKQRKRAARRSQPMRRREPHNLDPNHPHVSNGSSAAARHSNAYVIDDEHQCWPNCVHPWPTVASDKHLQSHAKRYRAGMAAGGKPEGAGHKHGSKLRTTRRRAVTAPCRRSPALPTPQPLPLHPAGARSRRRPSVEYWPASPSLGSRARPSPRWRGPAVAGPGSDMT